MLSWQLWLIVAGVCFIIEIITVGFLIFWLAIAALVVALLSLFINNFIAQTAIFIVLSTILILFTRPLANRLNKSDNAITNTNRLIGKTAVVKKAISSHNSGQVKVNGELWTATLVDNVNDTISEGSTVKIIGISGVKVVVEPIRIVSNT